MHGNIVILYSYFNLAIAIMGDYEHDSNVLFDRDKMDRKDIFEYSLSWLRHSLATHLQDK